MKQSLLLQMAMLSISCRNIFCHRISHTPKGDTAFTYRKPSDDPKQSLGQPVVIPPSNYIQI